MPRPPRFAPVGMPQHVIQRGANQAAIFAAASDYRFFHRCLWEACEAHNCHLHAFVFMTNHVPLLITPWSVKGVSKVMQSVGVRYVQRFNELYDRRGTLWQGRYRATLVEKERYLFACYRYVEQNPVRAGLVKRARDYPWSSHNANAYGRRNGAITPQERYDALGVDSATRQAAYRALFATELPDSTAWEIRFATNRGWALGSERFRKEVAALLGRRTEPRRAGRRAR